MKVLFIGNGNHQFIQNQVIWLRKKANVERLDIFSYPPIINGDAKKLFDNIYNAYNSNWFTETKKIKIFFKLRQIRNNIIKLPNDYDIIQIHYVENYLSNVINKIKTRGKRLVVSVWGSDLYRGSKITLIKKRKIYELADAITFFVKDETERDFLSKYKNISKEKFYICRFGSALLPFLKNLINEETRLNSKFILGLSPSKLIITIGYNGDKSQNHIPIINSIVNNYNYQIYKKNLQFVLPITYVLNKNYKYELLKCYNSFNLDFVYFDKFLTNEQMAHLRLCTDIMIQLQPTDVLSDSMTEHIFAQNIVITGNWLPYDVLIKQGIYFHKINKVDEVGEEFFKCISNLKNEKQICKKNTQLLDSYGSWVENIKDWITLYKNILVIILSIIYYFLQNQ